MVYRDQWFARGSEEIRWKTKGHINRRYFARWPKCHGVSWPACPRGLRGGIRQSAIGLLSYSRERSGGLTIPGAELLGVTCPEYCGHLAGSRPTIRCLYYFLRHISRHGYCFSKDNNALSRHNGGLEPRGPAINNISAHVEIESSTGGPSPGQPRVDPLHSDRSVAGASTTRGRLVLFLSTETGRRFYLFAFKTELLFL